MNNENAYKSLLLEPNVFIYKEYEGIIEDQAKKNYKLHEEIFDLKNTIIKTEISHNKRVKYLKQYHEIRIEKLKQQHEIEIKKGTALPWGAK